MALKISLSLDNEKLKKGLRDSADALQKTSTRMRASAESINASLLVATAGLAATGGAIASLVKKAADMETIETQFRVLTGSATETKKIMEELFEFTAKTPFQFKDVSKSAQMLLGFGIEADKIRDNLQQLGDVSAALGTPLKDLTLIFGQIQAAGKLTGERLLQLQERAVPIGPALAETMGVAESSIKDLVSQGKVTAEVFNKAFSTLNKEGGKAFQGMILRSKTLGGVISTLKDNFDLAFIAMGQNFLPVLKQTALAVIELVSAFQKNKELQNTIVRVLKLTSTILALRVAFLATKKVGLLSVANIFDYGKATLLATKRTLVLIKALARGRLATHRMRLAVKGLVGATGFGLFITFLPEILKLFKAFWSDAWETTKTFVEAITNIVKGLASVFKGVFTFDLGAVKAGWQEIKDATQEFSNDIREILKSGETDGIDIDTTVKSDDEEVEDDKKKTDAKIKNLTREKKLESKINKFYENEKVKQASKSAEQLEYLQKSKNKVGKEIGKAAAKTQVLIDAPKAAMGAYSALAPIPFIGPALGIAAAAAAIAYSQEQLTAIQKAQSGGIIQRAFGTPARGDFQPVLAEAGELVLPTEDVDLNRRASQLIVEKLSGADDEDFYRERQEIDVNIGMTDQASDLLNTDTIEKRRLGVGVI